MSGFPDKPIDTSETTPKPITDVGSKQSKARSMGLTCVKRYMPILPETPLPTPGSSPHAQGKPHQVRTVPPNRRKTS